MHYSFLGRDTWSPTVSASQISEAGMDYPSNYVIESLQNQTRIELRRGGGFFDVYFGNWRVDVSKSDFLWDNRLKLEIRRSGNGSGSFWSSIGGGTAYQELNNNPRVLFTGSGFFSNIPIQYKLSGFSVLLPVQVYSSDVIYTLIEL